MVSWYTHNSFCRASVDIEAREALAVVMFNGMVSWYPHNIFRSACSIDVTNYPFDNQVRNHVSPGITIVTVKPKTLWTNLHPHNYLHNYTHHIPIV